MDVSSGQLGGDSVIASEYSIAGSTLAAPGYSPGPLSRIEAHIEASVSQPQPEPFSHSQAFAFEIGRVGRSCVQQDPIATCPQS